MTDCSFRDCVIDPIKSECFDFCIELILKTATVEEKVLILGIKNSTANAIFRAYNSHPAIENFDDLGGS